MTPIFAYFLQVSICSVVLYAYYHFALRNHRFHQWNRYYLLFSALVSVVIPFVKIPLPLIPTLQDNTMLSYTASFVQLREQVLYAGEPKHIFEFNLASWSVLLYSLITVFALCRLTRMFFKIYRLLKEGELQEKSPYKVVFGQVIESPFSFIKYIFLPKNTDLASTEGQQILQHETAHLRGKHSLDNIFMEVLTAVFWFNPVFHFMKKELSMVHEFIADATTAKGNVAGYAETILTQAMHGVHPALASPLLQAPISRRIHMLLQPAKGSLLGLRKFMMLPVVLVCFCAMGFAIQAPPPPAVKLSLPKVTVENIHKESEANEIFTFVEQPPSYPGGEEALNKFLRSNVRYPEEASNKGKEGTIFVTFVVGKDGQVKDVKTVGKIRGNGLEEEALRVVQMMPKWNPGKQNNRPVNVQFNLPIRFTIQE
ncbi:TonB family protein [Chitinophaga skermanii]|uniref:TonB family protein n=1 Tax=Chitinophaga skermanii TaxID=331697 RepID=A0A327QD82_9BACT|nr:M56 family metallopeptidase [Chitinophaga skermanii]RAJ02529.1 TonB family protein [Chitinophaga skermanii]